MPYASWNLSLNRSTAVYGDSGIVSSSTATAPPLPPDTRLLADFHTGLLPIHAHNTLHYRITTPTWIRTRTHEKERERERMGVSRRFVTSHVRSRGRGRREASFNIISVECNQTASRIRTLRSYNLPRVQFLFPRGLEGTRSLAGSVRVCLI